MVVWLVHARVGHRQGLYPEKPSPETVGVFSLRAHRRGNPRSRSCGVSVQGLKRCLAGASGPRETPARMTRVGPPVRTSSLRPSMMQGTRRRAEGDAALFVHVETRRRSTTQWATLLLVLVCVASFVALALMPPPQRISFLLEWGTIPANIFDTHDAVWRQLADPALLRLFTALFIHVAWIHLLSNLL